VGTWISGSSSLVVMAVSFMRGAAAR